jgi:hypothetical protein
MRFRDKYGFLAGDIRVLASVDSPGKRANFYYLCISNP